MRVCGSVAWLVAVVACGPQGAPRDSAAERRVALDAFCALDYRSARTAAESAAVDSGHSPLVRRLGGTCRVVKGRAQFRP